MKRIYLDNTLLGIIKERIVYWIDWQSFLGYQDSNYGTYIDCEREVKPTKGILETCKYLEMPEGG